MRKQHDPTPKQMLYLCAIKRLDTKGRGIRSVALARELQVSRPSVHAMLKKLVEAGYVEQEHYGIVYLLGKGDDLVCDEKERDSDDAVDLC